MCSRLLVARQRPMLSAHVFRRQPKQQPFKLPSSARRVLCCPHSVLRPPLLPWPSKDRWACSQAQVRRQSSLRRVAKHRRELLREWLLAVPPWRIYFHHRHHRHLAVLYTKEASHAFRAATCSSRPLEVFLWARLALSCQCRLPPSSFPLLHLHRHIRRSFQSCARRLNPCLQTRWPYALGFLVASLTMMRIWQCTCRPHCRRHTRIESAGCLHTIVKIVGISIVHMQHVHDASH